MESFCIETFTYARKGVKLLSSHGISASLRRSDCAGKGCAFEISVDGTAFNKARRLLDEGKIPVINKIPR